MANCTTNVDLIAEEEYIGESLSKINQNFQVLKDSSCELKKKVDKQVSIRTFFYYGPNTPSEPQDGTAGMQSSLLSRPSNDTILNFVNGIDKLNLKPFSEENDIAYVIYQKTGWYVPPTVTYVREGSGQIPFTKIEVYTVTYWVGGSIAGGGGRKKSGGIAGKCWVAREVYDYYSPRWEIFRDWLFDSGKGPLWLQKIYLNHGEKFANWISNKVNIKKGLRKLFNLIVNKEDLDSSNYVSTPNGPVKAEKLKTGDIVYGYDPITGKQKECKVTGSTKVKNSLCVKIYHETGELALPLDQKVYVKDGDTGEGLQYIKAEKLKPGNTLYLDNNEESKILHIKLSKSKTQTQDIEVDETHNYIVNRVRVHNGWVTETRTRIVTYYVGYAWSTTLEDTYREYQPIFVIYRLIFKGDQYVMDSGWPKYTGASTESTTNWNSPQLWNTY